MLDNYAKKVLKFFIKTKSIQDWSTIASQISFVKNDKKKDIEIIEQALKDLLEYECIKLSNETTFSTEIYELTNKGKMYFKSVRKNNFYKYWYPIITALIAFLLSLITNRLSK